MVKKMYLLLIFSVIFFVAMSACSQKTESPGTSGASESEATTSTTTPSGSDEPNVDKRIEFSYLSVGFKDAVEGDWTQKELESRLNIKITDAKYDIFDNTQIDLMLASGELPDAAWIYKNPIDLYDQGLTRTIPKAFIEQYAPNYAKFLNDNPAGWKYARSKDNPDEYLAITSIADVKAMNYSPIFRLDWLENVGIQPKGNLEQLDEEGRVFISDTPFTQSEFTEILRAFTNNDPDQNGQPDTFGMSGLNNFRYYDGIMGMYGIGINMNFNVDGQAAEWFATPAFKETLRYLNQLFEEGLLDKEAVTNDYGIWNEKFGTGKYGASYITYQYLQPTKTDSAPYNAISNNPQAKILYTPPLVGDSGQTGGQVFPTIFYPSINMFINKDVTDEQLARILQFMDYIYFDPANVVMSRYGQEGVHWNWEGEPFASLPVAIEGAPKVDNYGGYFIDTNDTYQFMYFGKMVGKAYDYVSDFAEKYPIYSYKEDLFGETQYQEMKNQYNAAVSTIQMEFSLKAISGQVDLDAEWDQYINDLNAAGLDKMTAELNKAPLVADFLKQ